MYCGSSGRLGSLVMPLRLSVLTRYWSMTHSRAERLQRRSLLHVLVQVQTAAPARAKRTCRGQLRTRALYPKGTQARLLRW